MDKAISEHHSTATAPEMTGLPSFDRIAAYKAEQSRSMRIVNQQKYPLEQAAPLATGIARGVINASEGFIEFLAQPNAVSNALVGIGPQLDTAVNYYANTPVAQIGKDVGKTLHAAHQALAKYSQLQPEPRGEIIGSFGAQVLAGELCGEIAMQPVRSGTRELSNLLRSADAKDYSHLPEDMQNAAKVLDEALETGAKTERGINRVSRLTGSEQHAQHVQAIVDALPARLQSLLKQSGLTVKSVERTEDVFRNSPKTRARLHPDTTAIYIAEQFERKGNWMSEPETLPLVVGHELGHVIDRAGGFSHQRTILDAYRAGCRRLGAAERSYLGYFATGNEHGAMEAFAEIYGQLKTPATSLDWSVREAFRRAFPEMIEAVRQLDLP